MSKRALVASSVVAVVWLLTVAHAAQAQVPTVGCGSPFVTSGALDQEDPLYNVVQAFPPGGTCVLDVGGAVYHYEAYEVLVADPALFVASLCPPDGSTDFDSVVTLYQDPTASPASFNPAAPCTNAITASDDVCGSGSEAAATLQAGYAMVVVSSWTVGGTGNYTLAMSQPCPATPAIPALDGAGLAVLALLLSGLSILWIRRRRA